MKSLTSVLKAAAVALVFCMAVYPVTSDAGRFRGAGGGGAGIDTARGANGAGGMGFVDENGDGINDNFIDEDGDGVCDISGNAPGSGSGFRGGRH